MKKLIILIVFLAATYGGYVVVSNILENKNAWKVQIINEYVNVRETPSATANNLGTIYLSEEYKVLEIYEKDKKFIWYKIEYKDENSAWIASSREVPYVKEINNPNKVKQEDYVIDYKRPVIKFLEEVVIFRNINNINYDHLEIIEDSEYTITHEVYFEEKPIDKKESQYWIKYTVIDANDNKDTKIQRIEFNENPSIDEVLLFENIR